MKTLVFGEASSSSPPPPSQLPRSCKYHVFLSFRGQDTRKGFTDHLCASLQKKGITTFRDDKDLERGEVITHELVRAIEESMFAIVVLSPNYASSTWCLDELRKILDCNNNLGLQIVPVFYGVEPSHVRHQKRTFEEAFRKHEHRFGKENGKLKRWRDALTQVAGYSGWESKDRNEAILVEDIAQYIRKKLIPELPSSTNKLVGIVSRVEEVIGHMGLGLSDVRFVGIWGMGGIGKTTIARAVYEAIQREFTFSCFLANVRDTCERVGLVQMQKKIVHDLDTSDDDFSSEYDGRIMIQKALCHKNVLLVLDDVSKEGQLKNLIGEQAWFGPRSRVIITTRDIQLLKIVGVHGTYQVEGLVQHEAFDLFCLKAFKGQRPEEGYLNLSKELVHYSGGLPLALDVLGSYLYGRSIEIWRSAIEKLKSAPHVEILDTLKISYDDLDFMEKNIFLDIACFFRGMKREEVIDILNKFGYCAEIGIAILIDRSLVTIDQKTSMLEMHDLLQDMGRNIVIHESPNDPRKRSRLWSKEDIDLILTQNEGTEAIQSIVLNCGMNVQDWKHYKARWRNKTLSNISQLKFLKLDGMEVPIHLNLPSLKVLHWSYCTLDSLPLINQHNELVEIKISNSKIERLWHGKKFLKKLKCLHISNSSKLKQIPDVFGVPVLETLVLTSCRNLTNMHPSVIQHKTLAILNLSWCTSLKTLPGKLELSSLKELILDYCTSLKKLPEFGECMKHLWRISLTVTPIRKLPESLGCLLGLSDLNLSGCDKLTCFPNSIHHLKSLRVLRISWFPSLPGLLDFLSSQPSLTSLDLRGYFPVEGSFPCEFGQSLTDLDLSFSNFVSVPIRIHELHRLRRLWLNCCKNLKFLPELPSGLRELQACGCGSLVGFELSSLSKMCCCFVSNSQYCCQPLQMMISGTEIPPWFIHRHEGNSVSVPFPYNCSSNQSMGVAFCFLLETRPLGASYLKPLLLHNGKISCSGNFLPPLHLNARGSQIYILCLFDDGYFNYESHQDNHFELLFEDNHNNGIKVLRSASRSVGKEYVEELIESDSTTVKGSITFE